MIVEMRQFSSKSGLQEFLAQEPRQHLLLGTNADAPREYFCIVVGSSSGANASKIGILSYGIGVKPGWIVWQDKLFVGFNQQVVCLDAATLIVERETNLLSLFWEFLAPNGTAPVCVLCETSVVGLSLVGDVMWRVNTDLVQSYKHLGSRIHLEFADDPPMTVNLLTGQREAV